MKKTRMHSWSFIVALLLTGISHAFHARKAGVNLGRPYISHLLGTCALIWRYAQGLSQKELEDTAIAALLHDDVEDLAKGDPKKQRRIRRRIRWLFGKSVLVIVDGCTEDKSVKDWRKRKEAFVASFATASIAVRYVRLADKTDNLEEM